MRRPPKETEESVRRLNRRAVVLAGAQLGFAGLLGLQMRRLQVEQAEEFRMLAEENRINVRLIPPARGLIFDRDGVPLAVNDQNYRVVLVREDAGDVAAVLQRLARLVPLPAEEIARIRGEAARRPGFVPITVIERLDWQALSRVAVNAPALPGVRLEVGLSRSYPRAEDLAHVVGYVGPVSERDLDRIPDPDPLLQIPKFQIGKVGVEAKMERVLRGTAGSRQVEVSAAGRVMRELSRREGEAGRNLQLTVDAGLQHYVQARLTGESAAAVVLEVETGDLVAIASAPSYDPNKFVRGISTADYRLLTENTYRPLANKTVQGVYPPGSTFKMVTALAALEAGVIGPAETVWCPGHLTESGRRFHCWKRGGHGHMNLHDSLVQSCDVFYYDVARRTGIDRITAMARRLGLGEAFELPMSAVAEGLTPTQAWKRARYGEGWMPGDTLNSAIGQGFVLTSPLQLAVMTARLASDTDIAPRLVRAVDGVPEPVRRGGALGLDPANLRAIRRAMHAVSNNRRGTAYRSRVVAEAMELAGKTGTSQVRNITAAERAQGVWRNEDLPWERRDHALFVGYAPSAAPRYAVSVVVEHGGGGSRAAAPIARDVLLAALHGGRPPLEAYPAGQREAVETLHEGLPLGPAPAPAAESDRA